jgi:hypothetical protein
MEVQKSQASELVIRQCISCLSWVYPEWIWGKALKLCWFISYKMRENNLKYRTSASTPILCHKASSGFVWSWVTFTLYVTFVQREKQHETSCWNVTPIYLTALTHASRGLRSGDRAGQMTGLPRPMTPHRAWTTCVVVDHETHASRIMVDHSPRNNTLHLSVWWVRWLIPRFDELRSSARNLWKTDYDSLMPWWCGNCLSSKHGYFQVKMTRYNIYITN